MSENLNSYSEQTFENIKHINEEGQEYWLARELQVILEYKQWRRFVDSIERAKMACKNSGYNIEDHFADAGKMVAIGSGAKRFIEDYMLSRYACYLIVMNGDPRKDVIAVGQTYFAIKTRQQELIDNYEELTEDEKRIAIRSEMKRHNAALADAAHNAGVTEPIDYAIFQNYGEKLRHDEIQGKEAANQTHFDVGKKVRQTIKELGGTMPEDLPTPEKSIKEIEREQEKNKLK